MSTSSARDLLLSYLDETDETGIDTDVRLMAKVPLSIVVSKAHRLSNREFISLEDLRLETFIKLEGNFVSGSWRFIEGMCLQAGFLPKCFHVYFPE